MRNRKVIYYDYKEGLPFVIAEYIEEWFGGMVKIKMHMSAECKEKDRYKIVDKNFIFGKDDHYKILSIINSKRAELTELKKFYNKINKDKLMEMKI
jgi:hypothetical protein